MAERDAQLRFGDFVIDPVARSVSFGSDEIALTRREFDILFTLASHPGWVYSSETLATNDPSAYASPSSVNVHVSRLRGKLAAAGCAQLIETVRGVGYRFRTPGDVASSPAPGAESGPEDPFVGREREMSMLGSALSAAMGGDSRFVLVTGEPGVGKTRCAEELARRAPDHVLTAWGRCQPEGSPPHWLWAQILRTILDQTDEEPDLTDALARRADVLGKLLPELGGRESADVDPPTSPPDQSTFVLFDSVTRFLAEVSRRRPLLLILDDIQWATEPSLLLLEFVLRHLAEDHVIVVGLCRGRDPDSPVLDRVLGECAQRRRSECMELTGFSAREVSKFAATHGLADLSDEMAEAIMLRTGGNPFFVAELVKVIAAEGDGGGNLRPDDLGRLAPTPNVRNVVRNRVSRLSSQCREVLKDAAVFGSAFSVPALETVCGRTRTDLLDLLAEALDARILRQTATPEQLRFAHALVQQTIYQDMPLARRMELHGRIAEALERSPRGTGLGAAAIAYHYGEAVPAGYVDKAMSFALSAGRQAMERSAFAEAVEQFQRSLALLGNVQLDADSRRQRLIEIAEVLGDALAASARLDESAKAYDTAVHRCTAPEGVDRARILGKAAAVAMEQRRLPAALVAIDEGEAALRRVRKGRSSSGWRSAWVELELKRMWLYYYLARDEEFDQRVKEHFEDLQSRADAGQFAEYLSCQALMAMRQERHVPGDATVALARRQHQAAIHSGQKARVCVAEALLGNVLLFAGLLDEAEAHLEQAAALSDEVGDYGRKMVALSNLTVLTRVRGDEQETRSSASRCAQAGDQSGEWDDLTAAATANLTWLAWRAGDLASARHDASAALAVWQTTRMFPFRWLATWPLVAATLADGDVAAACEYARDLLEPGQQPPRGELAAAVSDALQAADAGDESQAEKLLRQAVAAGREFGYT